MKINASRGGRLVEVDVPDENPIYSGEMRSGFCECGHSYGDHVLLLVLSESRVAYTGEEYVPAECIDAKCASKCTWYRDRGKAA